MKAAIFTFPAFSMLKQLPGKWWTSLPESAGSSALPGINAEMSDDIACFWTDDCKQGDALVSIYTPELFTTATDRDAKTAVSRIAKIASVGLDGGKIAPEFGPFRHGRRISVFAYSYSSGRQRIVAEACPLGSRDFFVCGFGPIEGYDLPNYQPDYDLYIQGRKVADSVIPVAAKPQSRSVTLDSAYSAFGNQIGGNRNWEAWLRDLNPQQRSFVEMPLDSPIRLRGSAGTGKTLTLAIKAMRLLKDAQTEGKACRILFLTHSWALAEAADQLMDELDPGAQLRRDNRSLDVWPLLTLADSKVRIGSSSRRLLGNDSRSGKIEMIHRLRKHLEEYLQGDWIARRSGCRDNFVKWLEAEPLSTARKELLLALTNEFSSVFAAAGIHPRKRQDYLRLPRRKWMMDLEKIAEKNAVADLYEAYFDGLETDGLTGPEQLVSDYLKALSTFEWQRLRKTEGFDFILVDEMHLFDEQERFVIHQLLSDGASSPRVAMAIDPKQSPIEVFVSHDRGTASNDSNAIYKRANLPNPQKLDLTTAFRSTPQIRAFVQTVIDLLMNTDVNDEWETPAAESSRDSPSGMIPTFTVHKSSTVQFKTCFDAAKSEARKGNKKRVAILCLDAERFDTYLSAATAQYANEFTSIASQEDLSTGAHDYSRRFIVSMPEFVSGLQFDWVSILDVNDDATAEDASAFHRQHFLHELYGASSRARIHLELHATDESGGLSSLLSGAISAGQLSET